MPRDAVELARQAQLGQHAVDLVGLGVGILEEEEAAVAVNLPRRAERGGDQRQAAAGDAAGRAAGVERARARRRRARRTARAGSGGRGSRPGRPGPPGTRAPASARARRRRRAGATTAAASVRSLAPISSLGSRSQRPWRRAARAGGPSRSRRGRRRWRGPRGRASSSVQVGGALGGAAGGVALAARGGCGARRTAKPMARSASSPRCQQVLAHRARRRGDADAGLPARSAGGRRGARCMAVYRGGGEVGSIDRTGVAAAASAGRSRPVARG